AVRDDRYRKAASKRQIKKPQYHSIDKVLNDTRYPLLKMGKPEDETRQHERDNPADARVTDQSGDSVHQIAAIDELLADRKECPGKSKGDRQPFQVSGDPLECGQVGHLASQAREHWLGHEQLE